jgi:hypothetical protein
LADRLAVCKLPLLLPSAAAKLTLVLLSKLHRRANQESKKQCQEVVKGGCHGQEAVGT